MLLSQGVFGSIVTSFNLSSAQSIAGALNLINPSNKNNDVMLICTGSQTKWISESIYLNTGKIVELSLSTDLPDLPKSVHSVDCSFDPIVEPTFEQMTMNTVQVKWIAYKALIQTLSQRPYTAFPYTRSLSRAPPASVLS
ncbi:hypothetical protein GCM10007852_24360 [Agaribacter marinus]|uniref:Uncharacterized protein n=2 Tax=Agaribacter marinus TaxID=1431249 RepID=A0AA37T3R7_9ALTE|nr:hypothetical protein GCM10007852_24360 [Agaribacter marinus]